MGEPDLVSKYRASLKEGDNVKVLRREPVFGRLDDNKWKQAKVISCSETALTVVYGDGSQEVISWTSGRVLKPT